LAFKQGVFFNPRQPPPSEQPRLADAMHLVFTPHPQSGRVALYVNGYTKRIAGFDIDESDWLLARLTEHTETNAPRYLHKWRNGDVIVWDNVGIQHRRPHVPAGERRTLRQYEGVAE
jgi:taurine dioxygenase